ncbi:hypothetical protein [Acetivibrio clariflavus]|uniref:Uncharacterized protein n=1 Tax=Acetivibrio clariflavus (strain DSM 19732 / NBRC 101661 / EBR45) TaxID=720554 RepID=G8M077_ACECE|nr:hypothetical protein [Acetivibrio clariflavus]AEV66884.1 hypothetical protein Clocl_0132 [Acetivibrio clariflavus DSM 19732]
MLKTMFDIVVYMFATYGFIVFLHELLVSIKHSRRYKNSMIRLVLMVKNQGEVIEGVLRNALQRDFIRKLMPDGRLTVLDMGSSDDTVDILKKLEKDYEYIEVLKKCEMESVFESFDDKEEQYIEVERIEKN